MIEHFTLFALSSLVIIMVPGPTVLTVVGFALQHGKSVAFRAALAVFAADLTAVSLAGFGITALLVYAPSLVVLLTVFSGGYCIYLGIKGLQSKKSAVQEKIDIKQEDINKVITRQCYIITVLNPKGHIFFIAFLPQFIESSPVGRWEVPILALIFGLIGFSNALAYGFLAGVLRDRLNNPHFAKVSSIIF